MKKVCIRFYLSFRRHNFFCLHTILLRRQKYFITMVRYKNRYILLQVKSDVKLKLTSSELASDLRKGIQKYYGDQGAAMTANFSIKYLDERHRILIARIAHGPHQFLSSILPLLTKAGKDLARFRILYTGATIRQCKKHIIKHQNEFLRQTIGKVKDENDRQILLNSLVQSLDNE